MLIEKRFLPWGTQRAGCCTKLIANKRSHEKEDIVYCSVVKNDGSDRILWEEIFYDLRNWGKELSYKASITASSFRANGRSLQPSRYWQRHPIGGLQH